MQLEQLLNQSDQQVQEGVRVKPSKTPKPMRRENFKTIFYKKKIKIKFKSFKTSVGRNRQEAKMTKLINKFKIIGISICNHKV